MISEVINADIGDLLAELTAIGLHIVESRYYEEVFGNYLVDLKGPAGAFRITRDRSQYMIFGDDEKLRRLGLFRSFNDKSEFQAAVLSYVRVAFQAPDGIPP